MTSPQDREPLAYVNSNAELLGAPWRSEVRFPSLAPIFIALFGLLTAHTIYFFWGLSINRSVLDAEFFLFTSTCFLPLIVKSRKWGATCLAAVVCAAFLVSTKWTRPLAIYWPIKDFVVDFLMLLSVLTFWHAIRHRPQVSEIARAAILAASISALLQLMRDLFFSSVFYSRHGNLWRITALAPGDLATLIFWASAPWTGQSAAFRFTAALNRTIGAALFALIFAVSLYFAFFQVSLAHYSIRHGGPFTRSESLAILVFRGASNADLWNLVEKSDWTESQNGELTVDWRKTAVEFLETRDPSTCERLSKMLRRAPTNQLANIASNTLAKGDRTECLPLLLRYALFANDSGCTDAIVKFGARQAAWPLLINEVASAKAIGDRNPILLPGTRAQLANLMGQDCGVDPTPWFDLLGQKARGHCPAIPDSITDEADQVVEIFLKYADALYKLKHSNPISTATINRPDMDVPDTRSLQREVDRYVRDVEQATKPAPAPPRIP